MATVKPLGFPRNPINGQQYTFNGKKWIYNSNVPGWEGLQVTDVRTIKKDTSTTQVIFGNDDSVGSTSFALGDNLTMNATTKTISVSGGAGSGLNADLLQSVNGQRFLENLKSGIIYGGTLSVNGLDSAKFDIAAGSGIIVTTTGGGNGSTSNPTTTVSTVTWPVQSSITITNIGSFDTTWIYVDSNGSIQQKNGAFTDSNYRQYIILGALVHPNRTNIAFVSNLPTVVYNTLNQYDDFIRKLGPAKLSGHRISANGGNLFLDRSSGVSYIFGGNYTTNSSVPNTVSDAGANASTIYRFYSNGSGGFLVNTNSAVNPNSYDNDSGVLQAVGSSEWTIQRVFYFPGKSNVLAVYYGTQKYGSISEATSGIATEVFTESNDTKDKAIFCGWMIVRGSGTQLNNSSDAKFVQGSVFREIISGTGGGGSISYISELLDVQTSAPSVGQALIWDGYNWVNQKAITYISELDDVETSSPSNGQFLVWNGSNWINQTLTGKVSYVSSPTAPSTTLYNAGDRWYNTSTGIEYTLINDGDDMFWVNIYLSPNEDYIMTELTRFMVYVSSSSTPSTTPYKAGDKWFNTSTGVEYTLVDDGSDKQWVNLNTNFIAHVHPIYEITFPTATVSASTYTVQDTDYYIGVNYSGIVTITLPSGSAGKIFVVKDESGNASNPSNYIMIQGTGGDLVDGSAYTMIDTNYGSLTFIYRNGWRTI